MSNKNYDDDSDIDNISLNIPISYSRRVRLLYLTLINAYSKYLIHTINYIVLIKQIFLVCQKKENTNISLWEIYI